MSEKFINLGVREDLANALERIGVTEPTPIQRQTIKEALAGRSVIGQSATGTGKTFAYLLPLLQRIDPRNPAVQAAVFAPTYELAMQIYHQAQMLNKEADLGIECASLIGGANVARQIEKLKKKPQMIVGSAGRALELIRKGKLKLHQAGIVVLDEADRMLDDQNLDAVKSLLPSVRADAQYLLFSATMTKAALARAEFVQDPVVARLKDDSVLQEKIENIYFVAEFRDKIEVLRKITKLLQVRRGLVFVNRAHGLKEAEERLLYHGLKVAALVGDADKMRRKKAVDDFAKGRVQLLLATDIAARGLDIEDVDYVFNLDLPEDEKIYLHRAGRTGRAGKSGAAVTLADPKEVGKLLDMAGRAKIGLTRKKMAAGEIRGVAGRTAKRTAAQDRPSPNPNPKRAAGREKRI